MTPLARRLAAELGVDLGAVTGTGPDGAVREPTCAGQRPQAPPRPAGRGSPAGGRWPAAARPRRVQAGQAVQADRPAGPGAAESMRQAIARLMARSKREIPHYYLSNTVDMGAALAWLRERNRSLDMSERLVPAALLLRATALAARQVPELNGFWIDDALRPGGRRPPRRGDLAARRRADRPRDPRRRPAGRPAS